MTETIGLIGVLTSLMVIFKLKTTNRRLVNWQITFPLSANKDPKAVSDLMVALAEVIKVDQKFYSFGRRPQLICRILSDRSATEFIISVFNQQSQAVRRLIEAHLPGCNIKAIPAKLISGRCFDFKIRPKLAVGNSNQQDPIKFLTLICSQLEDGEQINYQILLKPTKSGLSRIVHQTCQTILDINSNHSYQIKKDNPPVVDVAIFKARISLTIKANQSRLVELKLALLGGINLVGGRLKLFKPTRVPTKLNWFGNQRLTANWLASLYHWPPNQLIPIDDLDLNLFKTLPRPNSLKDEDSWQIIIGDNHHRRSVKPIGLTADDRQRHMFVIGGTGSGKSEFLKYQIVQDIRAGRGVAVVDPHGDLAVDLLDYIPTSRRSDLVYVNPADLSRELNINLLEIDRNLAGNDWLLEADLITESTVSTLKKIFSQDGGHRIEYILRNTIQTALSLKQANLFTIYRLLNDRSFRRKVAVGLTNHDLKLFWLEEIGQAGSFQQVKMTAGVTAKIGRFLFSPIIRRIFDCQDSSFCFDQLINQNKILICNFAKGLIGEDGSQLMGATILAKLQLTALKRARKEQGSRRPFYLYVDEFQNFANDSFVAMLSEARKYQLLLTMAEQSTQQQADRQLIEVILANVGALVAFRSGSPAEADLLADIFKPFVNSVNLMNLPAYNFYARIVSKQPKDLVSGVVRLTSAEFSDTRG